VPRIPTSGGVELYYEETGAGEPVVLVHGSWSDANTWALLVPELAREFRVIAYDRRGHSRSSDGPGHGSRHEDECDLAAVIEALEVAPAHVVGNSYGGSIALGLAARRPELLRSVAVHEPGLTGLAPFDPNVRAANALIRVVVERLETGDVVGGARQFVEEVALGPGGWEALPDAKRASFIANAFTFVDEQRDPEWGRIDPLALSAYRGPVLLTRGDSSLPWLGAVADRVAAAIPTAQVVELADTAHSPQATGPAAYASELAAFMTDRVAAA